MAVRRVEARFVEDPDFVDNLLHWRGTLNPIGDKVRATANNIRDSARKIAAGEAAEATAAANALVSRRFTKSGRRKYLEAKALAYSLSVYAKMVYAAQVHQADQNVGIVAAGHAAGAMIEYGGVDHVIDVDGTPLAYSARSILRRAVS